MKTPIQSFLDTGVVKIHNKDYKTVALRVAEFREQYPIESGWSLEAEVIECSEKQVLMRAHVVSPEGRVVARGHAQETWAGRINQTSAVENCETSAIGRALAAAGFGGSEFASANEVQTALKQQDTGHTNRPPVDLKQRVESAVGRANTKAALLDLIDKFVEFDGFTSDDVGDAVVKVGQKAMACLSDTDDLYEVQAKVDETLAELERYAVEQDTIHHDEVVI